jgi:hypothetical protein
MFSTGKGTGAQKDGPPKQAIPFSSVLPELTAEPRFPQDAAQS